MESFRYRATFLFYESPILIVLVDRLEDDDILQNQTLAGYFLTTIGMLGIFTSFVIQRSEFDPTAFALSMVAIFIAIVGITLILQPLNEKSQTRTRRKRTSSSKFKRVSYLVRAI
jgi:DMSO reductase anchor subunit